MHPILANRDRLSLYLTAWVPIAVLLTAMLGRGSELSWLESLLVAFPMCLLYAFLCLGAWYICRSIPLHQRIALAMVWPLAASAVICSFAWVAVGYSWALAFEAIPALAGLSTRYFGQSGILFVVGVLLFLLAVAVHYLLLILEGSRAAEKKALELQVLAREAELRALRAQIDPHFLFNSLNSISALTVPDPASARRMCLRLADFMRAALKLGGMSEIRFEEELRLAKGFLEIEKVRFGERLEVDYRIDPDCLDCMVPPLLIQPLVENAVTHGVAPLVEGGKISIEAKRLGNTLEVVLQNPYDDEFKTPRGTGLGIRTVRERLSSLFADAGRVNVTRDNGQFRVDVRLPCRGNGASR